MTLESGPKNLEGGKIEAPRVPQEMLGAETHDDLARDDLQEVESDKEKGGAVKKKIEIPDVGEIEYTEKRIMFPEKIVQETGGVKGYVRKMVKWEELARFFGVSVEEFEKIKAKGYLTSQEENREDNERAKADKYLRENFRIYSDEELEEFPKKETIEKFIKSDGLAMAMKAMTNGEFIDQTMNHVLYGHSIKSPVPDTLEESLTLSKMLKKLNVIFQQIRGTEDFQFRGFGVRNIKTNQVISRAELFQRAGLSKEEVERVGKFSGVSEQEAESISRKILGLKDIYLCSTYGLNLTNPSRLWRGYGEYNRRGELEYDATGTGAATSPFFSSVVLGFKVNTRNAVLREYSSKAIKIVEDLMNEIKKRKIAEKKYVNYDDYKFEDEGVETLKAVLNSIEPSEVTGHISVVTRSDRENEHPRLPLIMNHPEIPDLRWCHADYAAIPTKNGYNIIEMIT